MRTHSTLATLILGFAGRALSALVTLLVAVAIIPLRVAMVESRWFANQPGSDTADPTEALLVSSWHIKPRRSVAQSRPAPDSADQPG